MQLTNINHLRDHWEPNCDLYLTRRSIAKSIPISYKWVFSHVDENEWNTFEELTNQNLL
jgi:hypothetical protein